MFGSEGKKGAAEQVIDGEMVTGNFTLQAQMPNGKSITMSGYIFDKNDQDEVNKRLDFFHDVMDRQRLKAEIPELEAKLKQRYIALGQLREGLAELEAKQKNGKNLTSVEKKNLGAMSTTIGKIKEDIADGEKAIADAKVKVGIVSNDEE